MLFFLLGSQGSSYSNLNDLLFFGQLAMLAMFEMHERHMHTRRCSVERSKEALRAWSTLSYCREKTIQVQITHVFVINFDIDYTTILRD